METEEEVGKMSRTGILDILFTDCSQIDKVITASGVFRDKFCFSQ